MSNFMQQSAPRAVWTFELFTEVEINFDLLGIRQKPWWLLLFVCFWNHKHILQVLMMLKELMQYIH